MGKKESVPSRQYTCLLYTSAAPITSLREYPYRLSAYKSSGIESFSKRSAIFLKRGPVRGMRANGPKLIESVVSRPIGATHK